VKKSRSATPILAAVAAVTGCVPMEPVEPVVQVAQDDEICRMESPIGSHVKEEDCKKDSVGPRSGDASSDRDIDGVFGDIVLVREIDTVDAPEGKCGSQ